MGLSPFQDVIPFGENKTVGRGKNTHKVIRKSLLSTDHISQPMHAFVEKGVSKDEHRGRSSITDLLQLTWILNFTHGKVFGSRTKTYGRVLFVQGKKNIYSGRTSCT